MRVDSYSSTAAASATEQVNKAGGDQTTSLKKLPHATKSQTEDKTTLTSGSDSVKALTTTALQTDPSRAAKVASLKQAVSSGQYQLDPAKIADSLSSSDV